MNILLSHKPVLSKEPFPQMKLKWWLEAIPVHACRGAGAFGDILYGSCEYASVRDGIPRDYSDLPFFRNEVAALAQKNPDYPGSCGRCYEIR